MTTGSRTEGVKGIGAEGFIRTVKNLTVTGDLVVHGETRSTIGTGAAFWEVADANANYWAFDLPVGGDINVPVVGFGIALDGVDLGLFDGITQTTVAVIDADRDSFIALDFSGDDASRIRSNTTINVVPTGALSVGSDGSGNDVIFYSGTSGDNLTWDSSEEVLQITGTNGQTSLDVLDGDVRIVDKLYFYDRGGEYMSSDGSTLTVAGTVVFSGSIEVQGSTTTISSSTTVIDDPLFHLGNDNNADSVDLGIFAEYTDSGKKFSGLFRDASDSDKWKLFATSGNSHEEPTTTVNTTSGFTLANLAVNELEGTLATAAQTNITSIGTLSALQVDYLNLNASTLQITDSSDTGDLMTIAVATHGATTITTTDDDAAAADLTLDVDGEVVIDPADAAGTIFKLNGTAQVSIIDGVIKPASTNDIDLGTADVEFKNAYFDGTVTSDAFAGPLSGNATTATALATGRTIAMTGDVAWTSASFDGSGNVTGAGTIQSGAVETAMLNDNVISGQTELAATGLAAEDELLVSDGGTIKRYGVDNLIKDSPALLADTTIADGDFIVFLDGGGTGTAKKEALADLVGVIAGTVTSTGLSDANSVLTLDIQNMTASSTIADADLIVIDDGAGGTLRKMTRANFIESAALDAINIDGGAIDAVTLGTNSAITEAVIDDINLNGKVITMTGSASDTAVFTAGTHGTLSIVTTDAAAAAANIQITADGTVDIDSTGALTLDSGAAINLEPASGSAILLDGVWTFDGSVVTPVATAHNAAGTGVSIAGGNTTAGTTSNISGGALTIQGGQGKGSGAGGDIIFQTANAGGSGSSLNSQATALTISDDLSATFTGIVDLTGTTDSSDGSGDTGILRVEGGASIAKKLFVGTDLDVDGTAELDNITVGGSQGSDGQVLTSTGSGVAWEDAVGGVSATTNGADNRIVTFVNSTAINGEANLTFDGSDMQLTGTLTVGVDDTGHDVKLFGATASAYLLWDQSEDKLLTAGNTFIDIAQNKLMIGGTAVTTTAAEVNVLDAVSAGSVTASLAVVVDSNKDIGSFRNVTLTGELDAATLDLSSSADIAGDLVLSGGADGALQFTNAGENSIKIPDDQASALIIEEANNAYITFTTTDSSEAITVAKATTFSGGIADSGTIAAGTWNGTDIGVAYGGTGASSLTDGGVLLGSGTGAITAMGVLTDGQMIVGDGSGDPVAESGATLRTSIGVGTGDAVEFAGITGTTIDATTDFTIGTLVITDDSIVMTPTTSDTVTIAAAANGVLNITTVDNAAAAANLNVVVDGAVDVDSAGAINLDAGSGIWTFEDSGTEVLRLTEGNSGDVTVKLVTNGKDLVFTDNGDATNMKILDAAAGINVPGEVQTTGIGYTDGDNAITIADGGGITFAQDVAVADSKFIEFESAAGTPTTDNTVQGIVIEFLAVEAITQFDAVYVSTTTGRVGRADANDAAKMPGIGIAIEAQGSAGSSVRVLTHGVYRDDGGFGGNMTVGVDLYAPETPGTLTTTRPSDDGDFIQVIGVATGVRSAFINPSLDIIEHA